MKKIIIFLIPILITCQYSVKDSNTGDNKLEVINENKLGLEKKEQKECKPIGSNSWNFLISLYNRGIPEDYMIFFTQKELRLIRNSIYAEKGYRFKSEELAAFFSSQSWYCPKYDNVDSLISPLENDLINYLLELEKKASNHYKAKEIHDYFLKLFRDKPKFGNNSIPIYFHDKYLHDQGAYRYFASEMINASDEYIVFIFNSWGGDPSSGLYFLTVIDKELNLLEKHLIENYEVLSENTIRVYLAKRNYNPDGDFHDDDNDTRFSLDTTGTKDYILDNKGKIKIVENQYRKNGSP